MPHRTLKNTEEAVFDIELKLLLEAVYLMYQHDFRHYSVSSLRRRLTQALHDLGLTTLSQLQERILRDATLFSRLFQYLTVQVSEMFRDPPYFRAIREQVVPILQTYPSIKVWVAAWRTGTAVVTERESDCSHERWPTPSRHRGAPLRGQQSTGAPRGPRAARAPTARPRAGADRGQPAPGRPHARLNRNTLRKRCRELSLPATRVVRRPRVSASARRPRSGRAFEERPGCPGRAERWPGESEGA